MASSASGGALQHDPETWLRAFQTSIANRDWGKQRRLRISICEQMMAIFREPDAACQTQPRVYRSAEETIHGLKTPCTEGTERKAPAVVEVQNGDCLSAALDLKRDGYNPVVLNMASAKTPGGGWRNGAAAQEENMFRRTNYATSLSKENVRYPLASRSGVYSHDVTVFRGPESEGYPFLSRETGGLPKIAFVAVAAVKHPPLVAQGKGSEERMVMADDAAREMLEKIRTILAIAVAENHNSIVLSAFGCGAYKCPAEHVARLFRAALEDPKDRFAYCFSKIVFAIFDDYNATHAGNTDGNLAPFQRVFSEPLAPMTGHESDGAECQEGATAAAAAGSRAGSGSAAAAAAAAAGRSAMETGLNDCAVEVEGEGGLEEVELDAAVEDATQEPKRGARPAQTASLGPEAKRMCSG